MNNDNTTTNTTNTTTNTTNTTNDERQQNDQQNNATANATTNTANTTNTATNTANTANTTNTTNDERQQNDQRPTNFEYDAFISYKHSERDKEITLLLHKMLESFKMSKSGKKYKVKRIFLDTEELSSAGSLSESIQYALDNSRYLIVVCSKETPSSPWVKKEIEYFVSKHGHDNVLALLIDGEPDESFPEPLKYANIDGVLEEIEPLAADIRAENPKQSKKALRREILRLLAPLLGVTYDELRQRHQKMVIRKVIRTASLLAALFLCFGIYAGIQWRNIAEQNELIRAQNALISGQKDEISEQNIELDARNAALEESNDIITARSNEILSMQSKSIARDAINLLKDGNRRLALYLARKALPTNLADPNPDKPYVEEAQFALTEALGVYAMPHGYFHSDAVFNHDSKVTDICLSPDAELLATATAARITIWRIADGAKLVDLPVTSSYLSSLSDRFTFSADGGIIYTDAFNDALTAVDALTGEIIWQNADVGSHSISKDASFAIGTRWNDIFQIDLETGKAESLPWDIPSIGLAVRISDDGRYAEFSGISGIYIVDTASGSILAETDSLTGKRAAISGDTAMFAEPLAWDIWSAKYEFTFYDLETGGQIGKLNIDDDYYRDVYFVGDNLIGVVYYDGYEIFDYVEGRSIERVVASGVKASAYYNDALLFLALSSGEMNIYAADTGLYYESYSFDFPDNASEILCVNLVMAGSDGSAVHILREFETPNNTVIEGDIVWAEFLDNGRLLGRINDSPTYPIALWSDHDGGEIISLLEIGAWPSAFCYDAENRQIYYIVDEELTIVSVGDDALTVEKTIDAEGMWNVTITESGIPVLFGLGKAVLFPGTPDSVEIEWSVMASEFYERGDAFIVAGYSQMGIIRDGETVERPSSQVYAINPVADEYVYFEKGELIFGSLFSDDSRSVDVRDLGIITSLFYSPDAGMLFIAIETMRLYSMDLTTLELTEMTVDFYSTPDRAYYIGDILVIEDRSNVATFWDPQSMKIIGQTIARLRGFTEDKLLLNNGRKTGVVPIYDLQMLMDLADETLGVLKLDERDKAAYFAD